MMIRATAIFFVLLLLPNPSRADELVLAVPERLKSEIPEFGMITPTLSRGGQPSEKGLEYLHRFGVRTIINFRHEPDAIEWEKKKAESLGLNYVSLPWRVQFRPKEPVMKQFLELVGKNEEGPFFFHCRRGSERTGVADALYRNYYQKLPAEEAFRKATQQHPILFYWRPFMKARYREFVKELGPPASFQSLETS